MMRFQTLLLREWMQHHRGWLILMLAPITIGALVLAFGNVNINLEVDGQRKGLPPDATVLALMAMAATTLGTLVVSWLTMALQLPGLARRDQQDRSIEFWLSLPTGHAQSLGATLLMHLLLMPWLALLLGAAGGQVIAMLLVSKAQGLAAWICLPWASVLLGMAALTLRLALGAALAMLWLSPLLLGAMAASAWLKRWGLPALIGTVVGVGLVADKGYGTTLVWDTLQQLGQQAAHALLAGGGKMGGLHLDADSDVPAALGRLPQWAWYDALAALQALGSGLLIGAVAVAAGCFALLVLRRQRGAA